MKTHSDPVHPIQPIAARLKPEQAADYIGCAAHDIPILVRAGLLKPLGRSTPNAVKYFSKRKVIDLCADDARLARVTDALVRHWQAKNGRRYHREPSGPSACVAGKASRRDDANPSKESWSPLGP